VDKSESTLSGDLVFGTYALTVVGVLLYLSLVAIGLASTVLATVTIHRRLSDSGKDERTRVLGTVGAGVVCFLGGWIFFDIYWLGSRMLRLLRSSANGTNGTLV
jgi:hypothetical protein